MSKKVILGLVILVCLVSASFAVSSTDGVYQPTANTASEDYLTVDTMTDSLSVVKAKGLPESLRRKLEALNKPAGAGVPNPFADVTTNFFVDANSQSEENAPVSQAQLTAGFTAQKGAFNVQFTHSRAYSRYVDAAAGYVEPNFQGTVNNRITFGATFSPDVINSAAASTVAVGTPTAPSAPAQPSASISSAGVIN
ncbi:MAG: hypothetical protein NT099_07455 [Candidatus Saganbacteria bacterium]|nr:hypothetical protein [Candidatus Saganbacteria bacterium]